MENKILFYSVIITIGTLMACTAEPKDTESVLEPESTQEIHEEENVVDTFFGSYNLTDMIPVTGEKELTSQDKEYINASKERTIGHTTLMFNEDGTFERIFPHPSGDGSINKWTGTYVKDEEAATLVMNAEINGKTMPIEFTIEDKTATQLSLKSDFGQIYMTYVYTK